VGKGGGGAPPGLGTLIGHSESTTAREMKFPSAKNLNQNQMKRYRGGERRGRERG
jgi:hypothetical protein